MTRCTFIVLNIQKDQALAARERQIPVLRIYWRSRRYSLSVPSFLDVKIVQFNGSFGHENWRRRWDMKASRDYSIRALLADSWGCSHCLEELPSLVQSQFHSGTSTTLDWSFFQSVCEVARVNVGKRLQKTCQTRLQKDVVFRWCWGWIKVGLTLQFFFAPFHTFRSRNTLLGI